MASKEAGRRKFAELMANHLLRHIHRHMFVTVMYCNGVANHIRGNHGPPGPGFDEFFIPGTVESINLLLKMIINVGSFFEGAWHVGLKTPVILSVDRVNVNKLLRSSANNVLG